MSSYKNSVLSTLPRPVIFAHRGASAYAPENTLAAFELALRQGADAIELDAKLSADGHVVVIHDATLDRTTASHGKVNELSLVELRKMDAGSHFDVAFKGEGIPTLEEVLKAVGQLTVINIELTNYTSPFDDLAARTANLVRRYKLTHRIHFSSFNWVNLWRIRRLLPECPTGLLAAPGGPGYLARSWPGQALHCQALHVEKSDVTPALVASAHRSGRIILVYTVNEESEMLRLFQLNVDGIFTDDPVLALQVREIFNVSASNPA